MEPKKLSGEQQEMLELVLKDLVEEHAKTNLVVADLVTSVNVLTNKVKSVTEKIDTPPPIRVPEPDTSKIQEIIEKGIQDIRLTISVSLNKPKPTRFQLFMESKSKTWFVVIVLGFFLLTYGFFLFIYHVAKA